MLPPSLWAQTAIAPAPTPQLMESTSVDVAIVGAGYTGLSTALHLAEAGAKVCVLDTNEPGWGASGRNGGQVIPGLKHDPEELLRRYGVERGERLIKIAGSAADVVFDLIHRHDIECQPVRKGWIQPAHSTTALALIQRRADSWAKTGAKVEMLDRAAVAERVGSHGFAGGWVDHRAGGIQPLSYTRGLAKAAKKAGASIHGHTEVTGLRRDGGTWTLRTSAGAEVRAERVLIATNGYSGDLWPGLRQTVIAANSFIVATEPLAGAAADTILPRGEVCSNSKRLLLYFRRDAEGRLLIGGRGPFRDPREPNDFSHLERALNLMFPQLGQPRIAYRWAGRVAITRDFMPHVHEPAPGLTIALGYNGRGIAMATVMGRLLSERMQGATDAQFGFPVGTISPIPLHGLQRFYIAAGVRYYSMLDALG